MMRKFLSVTVALMAGFAMASLSSPPIRAAQAAAQQPAYTIPEYNAYQAANAEKDPQAKIKLLDDFVSKFPNSTLPALRAPRSYYKALRSAKELSEDHRVCGQTRGPG